MEMGISAPLSLSVVLAVCMSACNNSYPSGGVFMKHFWISLWILYLFIKFSKY